MKCKECGYEQHACGSCGLADWEWEYCTATCMIASNNKKKKALMVKLVELGLPEDKADSAMDAILEEMEWA